MNKNLTKTYGRAGWIVGGVSYEDSLDVPVTKPVSATIPATFAGTLEEAVAAAPALGSRSELLPSSALRLQKRSFSDNGGTVSATFVYAVFGEDEPRYTLDAEPKAIPLLQHPDFAKAKDVEKLLAQEYVNGGTDATVLWKKKDALELASSVPASERDDWERFTLGDLVKEHASESRLVRLARKGKKTLPSASMTWTETVTTSKPNVPNRLGESANPRGSGAPSGQSWILSNYSAQQISDDENGKEQFTAVTTWKTAEEDETEEKKD